MNDVTTSGHEELCRIAHVLFSGTHETSALLLGFSRYRAVVPPLRSFPSRRIVCDIVALTHCYTREQIQPPVPASYCLLLGRLRLRWMSCAQTRRWHGWALKPFMEDYRKPHERLRWAGSVLDARRLDAQQVRQFLNKDSLLSSPYMCVRVCIYINIEENILYTFGVIDAESNLRTLMSQTDRFHAFLRFSMVAAIGDTTGYRCDGRCRTRPRYPWCWYSPSLQTTKRSGELRSPFGSYWKGWEVRDQYRSLFKHWRAAGA